MQLTDCMQFRTMSAVWLQLGQCGNQLGLEWWQLLTNESAAHQESDRSPFSSSCLSLLRLPRHNILGKGRRGRNCRCSSIGLKSGGHPARYPFFARDGKLSALCVDSEPKVIRKLQKQIKKGVFRDSNLILGQSGRGNNWAYGYHDLHSEGETSLLQRTMESLRKEVERRDCYSGTVLLHSLSGGTGSGLGARLCEAIRDEYPLGYILSVTVAPHQAGESPLQHYNSLLSLSWLQRYADGILLFHNDSVLKRTAALLRNTTAAVAADTQPHISFSSMNTYIASCLAGLLYPINMFKTGSRISMGMEPWELLRSVCPNPTMKFLYTAQACKRGTAFWDSLISSVVHTLPRESASGQPVSFII
ncbi:tubulin delta chain-like, partial [Rhinatrema bivittatum]|uniref:tubulin delta chain-like n=1 Tax=Rhinatrema bivittatum TaxID=194408 RepID=UPI00112E238B